LEIAMSKIALLVAAAILSASAPAVVLAAQPLAQPMAVTPNVSVTIGGDLAKDVEKLGERDVREQAEELARVVQREMARDADTDGRWTGAQVNLVLTDLKPNRPTMQQTIDRPGLSMQDSKSIGGATIEGEIVTAEGERLPVRYERYSTSLAEVFGYTTWSDASRAYDGLAANMRRGRLTNR
jgi:hypothetical protein